MRAGSASLDSVYASDAMAWSMPTYHGSVSGSFKNALDWLILLAERDPPYLTNKPVGLVSTADGVHGLQSVNSMDFIVRALVAGAYPWPCPSHSPGRPSFAASRVGRHPVAAI
jgi:NAD(P)H-dependent FMN reductase